MTKSKSLPSAVAEVYDSYPLQARRVLMKLRGLVFKIAKDQDVGPITETLKWGEPAYLTEATKSGTTIRLAWKSARPEKVSVFLNCKTTLIGDFRELFPNEFAYEGNRGLHLRISDPLQVAPLTVCLMRALTYHLAS